MIHSKMKFPLDLSKKGRYSDMERAKIIDKKVHEE